MTVSWTFSLNAPSLIHYIVLKRRSPACSSVASLGASHLRSKTAGTGHLSVADARRFDRGKFCKDYPSLTAGRGWQDSWSLDQQDACRSRDYENSLALTTKNTEYMLPCGSSNPPVKGLCSGPEWTTSLHVHASFTSLDTLHTGHRRRKPHPHR